MMKTMIYGFLTACLCLVFMECCVFSQQGKDPSDQGDSYNNSKQVVKTVENLKFVVEEDRPIEKVGGVYQPLSLDNYVAYKFDRLEKKMNETSTALEKEIKDLSRKVDLLDQKVQGFAVASKLKENSSGNDHR